MEDLVFFLAVFLVILVLLGSPTAVFFGLRWFVRYNANRQVPALDEDGKPKIVNGKRQYEPAPRFWCFVPVNCTAYLQKMGNNLQQEGEGAKSTPGSGSNIDDFIHNVPGMIADRSSPDTKEWHLRKCERGEEDNHRKGLIYDLFGAHYIGLNELRWVKVREVRVSLDDEAVHRHKKAMIEWERGGMQGDKPKAPRYEEHPHVYKTLFPYYSREHDVIIRNAETAGAYTVDISMNLKYKETYPIRARIEVADPNAFLTELTEQTVNNQTGAHEPEYYLFGQSEVLDPESSKISLETRRNELVAKVETEVGEKAEKAVGLTIERAIFYAIDPDEAQRELLELQETTERVKQAEILSARHDNELAALSVERKESEGEGDKRKQLKINDGLADRVERVDKPLAGLPNGPAMRMAQALEQLTSLTSLTIVPGAQTVVPVGGNNSGTHAA